MGRGGCVAGVGRGGGGERVGAGTGLAGLSDPGHQNFTAVGAVRAHVAGTTDVHLDATEGPEYFDQAGIVVAIDALASRDGLEVRLEHDVVRGGVAGVVREADECDVNGLREAGQGEARRIHDDDAGGRGLVRGGNGARFQEGGYEEARDGAAAGVADGEAGAGRGGDRLAGGQVLSTVIDINGEAALGNAEIVRGGCGGNGERAAGVEVDDGLDEVEAGPGRRDAVERHVEEGGLARRLGAGRGEREEAGHEGKRHRHEEPLRVRKTSLGCHADLLAG